jgi:hypothetical protein
VAEALVESALADAGTAVPEAPPWHPGAAAVRAGRPLPP